MVTSGIDEVLQRKWPPEHSYSCYIGIRAHPTPPAAFFRASILKRLFDEAKSKSIIIFPTLNADIIGNVRNERKLLSVLYDLLGGHDAISYYLPDCEGADCRRWTAA